MWCIVKATKYAINTDSHIRGGSGEADIRVELEKLSDDYSYFRGVKIRGTNYDVDFVVVGPTGIFAIDAKSHNGNIEFRNGGLLKSGRSFEKNVIWQAKQEALFINKLIREKYKAELFITPVIVFSSYSVKMHFGLNSVGNVYIIQKNGLISF